MKSKSLIQAVILSSVFGLSVLFSPKLAKAFDDVGEVTCYSESRSKSGASYYSCGDCDERFNSKGVGSSGTCSTGSGPL